MMNTDKHIVSSFDRDLEGVQALVMKMGGLVEAAMLDAAQALDTRDEELAQRVRAGDKAIDALEEQIHTECARLIALRRAEPALRHDRWFVGGPCAEAECAIVWLAPDGRPMQDHDWHHPDEHAFACQISPGGGASGSRLLLLFNPEDRPEVFGLPSYPWHLALDSSGELPPGPVPPAPLTVPPWSLVVLRENRT